MNTITDLFAHPPPTKYKGVKANSIYLPMRDGIQIAVDVMLPADLPPTERVPAIMVMARYWRSFELRTADPPKKALIGPRQEIPDFLIPLGFAVVVVDGRGSGVSTGSSRHPWSPDELADYAEVAAWIRAQEWCSGSIGAYGISYEGVTAQQLAASGVPGIKGVVPQEIEFDVYTDIALPGGLFNMAFIREWNESNTLLDNHKMSRLFPWTAKLFVKGVRPVDADRKARAMIQQALHDHQANTNVYEAVSAITYRDDPFGDTGATLDDFSVFRRQEAIERGGAALFSWGSWLDGASADAVLRNFNTLANPQIAIIGAWKHEMTAHGSPYQKPKSAPNPLPKQQWTALAQFFDQTLKREEPPTTKRLFYYTLGEEAWKHTDQFPLPSAQPQRWYFHADRGLAPEMPTAQEAADRYAVDLNASTGTTNRWHTQMAKPLVYADRAREDSRLLTYTSAPLERDLEITGYPIITLFLASSETDGAFFAYLEDVDERGVVRYLTEGQLRGLHRQLASTPPAQWMGMPYRSFKRADRAPLTPNERVELTFGLLPTSALIRRGHRLRVALAGADKDTFAPVPPTSAPVWHVHRSRDAASSIQLPVIPR